MSGRAGDQAGRVESRHAPDEDDPTEGVPDFEQSTVQGVTVWIRDRTTDPLNPSNEIRFATRINDWNVRLYIQNENTNTAGGPLRLTDEKKHTAAQFLVGLARQLSAT